MKRVKFVRHAILTDPYTDYTNLTLNQISDLASERLNPNIHSQSLALIKEKFSINELAKVELILTSNSNRTIQTGKLIKQQLTKEIPLNQTKNLSEIHFDPKLQMSEEEYNQKGLSLVRQRLFKGILEAQGSEHVKEILNRVKALEIELKKRSEKNILCITHSFYMRILRLFFLEGIKDIKKITVKKLMRTEDSTFLEGFEINI